MTDSVARWARVQDIFHTALERTSADRDSLLREACGDDHALRAEVDSLLLADGAAGAFAERPAIEAVGPLELTGSADRQLQPGDRLGAYTIKGWLGAGGMGEVYRARDSELGRDVALKLLPRIFDIDPERRARFDREARLLAALNHPHIGAIYGVVDSDGIRALVLELVEGLTLAERLASRPVEIPVALRIATEIAEALEAAHEGRRPSGSETGQHQAHPRRQLKVLDFGLASAGEAPPANPANSPTSDRAGTARIDAGHGGLHEPEQAVANRSTNATDIWAFGVRATDAERPQGVRRQDGVAHHRARDGTGAGLGERCRRPRPRASGSAEAVSKDPAQLCATSATCASNCKPRCPRRHACRPGPGVTRHPGSRGAWLASRCSRC